MTPFIWGSQSQLMEAGRSMVVARDCGRGIGELLFYGNRVSVLQDEKVLTICCTAVWVYITVLNSALETIKTADVMTLLFTTHTNQTIVIAPQSILTPPQDLSGVLNGNAALPTFLLLGKMTMPTSPNWSTKVFIPKTAVNEVAIWRFGRDSLSMAAHCVTRDRC